MPFRNLPGASTLTSEEFGRLSDLIAEWQLLADLSFADLVLWIPKHDDQGFIAVAQIRPMTAATVFATDIAGREISPKEEPNIDNAFTTGNIIRDLEPTTIGEFTVKEEIIPVKFGGKSIAVITRHRNIETMRTPSRLELNYREIANHIYRMVAEGNFPIQGSVYRSETAPRAGDGLVRLDVDGRITFASPNARSAFGRIGWLKDMDGQHFGEILDQLAVPIRGREPREESWRVVMSGRSLRRDEFENSDGVIDLLAIPLTESEIRIGAVVLVHNVTELRRRDRALVSKDATIREIHHRVKNNLQAVSALLRLQSRRTEDGLARSAIEEAIRRIASIAHVHETLSTSSQDSVQFDEVVVKLLNSALELSPRPTEIKLNKSGDFGLVPSLIATPLALVLTELIQNALEHGLNEQGSKLEVQVIRRENRFKISVVDDGAGLSKDFDLAKSSSLGLEIVKTLTDNELSGELRFNRLSPGTEAQIEFQLN
ncbi:MAG: histidine kinase [Actinobacteria bacterium]|jgi:two-component sensor histidine kinase|nr:histidine kinase [Actinomycetota bacterium]NCW47066.1 histidine kinase [Actinomycetota bacterium]NCW96625.1 histidine kinase [Actinomycetota bacterium]NCX33089.1 histidine kinase [Actinomycetota bacterium]NCX75750.1 histidine kinase [Actinomycetota bacterium]